ncbi:MAG TPA: hypothetical protein PLZ60_13975 [Kiritimatiellia bacterium]|nr:hypothetical protein [Kiritimatiellia bacterium]
MNIDISHLNLSDDDILLIRFKQPVSQQQFEQLQRAVAESLPGKSVLLTNGIDVDVSVIRNAELPTVRADGS